MPAVLYESQTERRGKLALAPAGRAKEQDIGTPIRPPGAGGERHHCARCASYLATSLDVRLPLHHSRL